MRSRPIQTGQEPGFPFVVHDTALCPVQALNPAPYNPRVISPEKFEGLKRSIRQNGFLEPMVIQKESPKYGGMVVVGGHQRLKAVREIGIEQNLPIPSLPCVILDIDDRTAKLLNVALNNLPGEFDPTLLGELLEDVNHERKIAPDEISLMGFDDADIAKYLHLADPPVVGMDEPKEFGRSVTLSLEFKDVRQRDAVKEKLIERARATKRTTGEVIYGLLGGGKKRK
jgi:ParB-like chromosome segregation protein Spo0J